MKETVNSQKGEFMRFDTAALLKCSFGWTWLFFQLNFYMLLCLAWKEPFTFQWIYEGDIWGRSLKTVYIHSIPGRYLHQQKKTPLNILVGGYEQVHEFYLICVVYSAQTKVFVATLFIPQVQPPHLKSKFLVNQFKKSAK